MTIAPFKYPIVNGVKNIGVWCITTKIYGGNVKFKVTNLETNKTKDFKFRYSGPGSNLQTFSNLLYFNQSNGWEHEVTV